jgi:hypothetical protein
MISKDGGLAHMKTNSVRFLICTLGCLLTAGTAWTQTVQSPEAPGATNRLEDAISVAGNYQNYIYGVVKKIESDQIVLDKTRFGDDQVFKLVHNTKFIDNGKRGKLAELKVGDMVWVDAKIKKKTNEKIVRKVITGVGPKAVSQ